MEWDSVIGLEVHAQLKTQSKLFSGASTAFGAPPNSQTSFIDAGLPGVLPVLNAEVLIMAIQFGLAVDANIHNESVFERKNYFYPDLPKGYQISQLQRPLITNGKLRIYPKEGGFKDISIVRAHLEEDAGKSVHERYGHSGIDLNRAGIPLLEIVTSPCLFSSEETLLYLKTLHQLLRFLNICDGNMQEGSFRCDVNISLKPKGAVRLGTRTELKNLNSFRFIEKAIAFERRRHQDLLENNQAIQQETRLYNAETNATYPMREKECENDYRYFPDPDLLPIQVTRYQIAEIKNTLPPLPEAIYKELKQSPSLSEEDIHFLLSSLHTYQYYKATKTLAQCDEKLIINWLKGPYSAALNERQLSFETPLITPLSFATLLNKVFDKSLSTTFAKRIFTQLTQKEEAIDVLIAREGYCVQNSEDLENRIHRVLNQFPSQVAEYQAGKDKLLSFFVGQVIKQSRVKTDPEQLMVLLKTHLALQHTPPGKKIK